MLRIGIVTLIGHNLGNRLQNFAMQVLLEKYGCVETIPLVKRNEIYESFKILLKKVLRIAGIKKNYAWDAFNKKIRWSEFICGVDDKLINEHYDYLIAGSDQIWNPNFEYVTDREFLTSVDPKKRVAFAASIGVSDLSISEGMKYSKLWKEMKAIAVRERSAVDIIEKYSGIIPSLVLDPTMLINRNIWNTLSNESQIVPLKKFIVIYFLNKESYEYKRDIENYARNNYLEIYDLIDLKENLRSKMGPLEFVKLIKDSEFVFTDSFHATAFSIIFNKVVCVFNRKYQDGYGDMNSRIRSLEFIFEIEHLLQDEFPDLDKLKVMFDWEKINLILKNEQEKSFKFLDDNIN